MKAINELPEKGKFVVLFKSDHCPHCKKMEKLLRQVEKNKALNKELGFFSINISKQQDIAEKYNVRSVPLTVFINGKKIIGQELGAVSIKAVEMQINDLLKDGEFIKSIKRLFGSFKAQNR